MSAYEDGYRDGLREGRREAEKLKAELERWREIDKRCHNYWIAEDPEYGHPDWWDAVEGYDQGDIIEVWRGGTVEKAWCGYVGSDLIKEPTREAAEAKAKELMAKLEEDEDE